MGKQYLHSGLLSFFIFLLHVFSFLVTILNSFSLISLGRVSVRIDDDRFVIRECKVEKGRASTMGSTTQYGEIV